MYKFNRYIISIFNFIILYYSYECFFIILVLDTAYNTDFKIFNKRLNSIFYILITLYSNLNSNLLIIKLYEPYFRISNNIKMVKAAFQ